MNQITIPSTVSYEGITYDVVEIGDFAFADYKFDPEYQTPYQYDENVNFCNPNLYVKKITLSDGIEFIGEYAFGWEDNFDNYRVVDVPACVTTIDRNAFHTSSLVRAVRKW